MVQHSYVANSFSVVGICPVQINPQPAKFPYSVLAVVSCVTVKQPLQCVQYACPLQIDAPMELQSCNVLLNCNNTLEDSHIVDGTDRETRFRMRQTDFGSCRVTVKGVRNGVNVAMGTTSVPS